MQRVEPTGLAGRPDSPPASLRLRYTDVFVESWAAEIPTEVLTTATIESQLAPLYRKLGFKPGWVEAVTGIRERRMWAPGVEHHLGASKAASRALSEAGIAPEEVGALVSCSVYKGRLEPSIASEIQAQLGIGSHCVNFDVGNACLGFLTGMATVANMIALGQIEVGLVVSGEDAGPVVRATIEQLRAPGADIHAFKNHLATLTLGSGAAAAVLTSGRRSRSGHRLLGGTSVSAAEHADLCVGDASGMKTDAVKLLREGVALAGRTWEEVTELLSWGVDDVSTFAMHQVGKAHHDTILRRLGVPDDRAPQIYPWMGNVGSCGVPITAILASEQGRCRPGDHLALMGIGSGLNCMMMGISW